MCLGILTTLAGAVSASAAPLKVGLILDQGGKDDKSFNSAAYLGATKAEKELGIQLKYVEAVDINAQESLHRSFAKKGYDLIIGVGFSQADAIKKVAGQNPKVNFAIVDGEVQAENVRSLLFAEHEGSFIVGAIAGLTTKSGKVGYIGGMDIPLIRRFALGYQAGVKQVNPKATVFENFIGVTGDAWNNPAKGKELALSQYGQGADIIFVAAGASGTGVFDAAEQKKLLAIGVDSNQNWMRPGHILTSMLKRVDLAVFDTIKQLAAGKFKGEVVRYGLADQGVDYSLDEFNDKLIPGDVRKKIADLKAKIIKKEIVVPDYYLSGKK
jgi:basic membrane protein A